MRRSRFDIPTPAPSDHTTAEEDNRAITPQPSNSPSFSIDDNHPQDTPNNDWNETMKSVSPSSGEGIVSDPPSKTSMVVNKSIDGGPENKSPAADTKSPESAVNSKNTRRRSSRIQSKETRTLAETKLKAEKAQQVILFIKIKNTKCLNILVMLFW